MRKYLLWLAVASIVLTGCTSWGSCRQQSTAYFADARSLIMELRDAIDLGASSSRIALGPVVSEMQSIKRDFDDLDAPRCAAEVDSLISAGMQDCIDGFLAFMANEDESAVMVHFNAGLQSIQEASSLMAEME
jgi:hypothetical protein